MIPAFAYTAQPGGASQVQATWTPPPTYPAGSTISIYAGPSSTFGSASPVVTGLSPQAGVGVWYTATPATSYFIFVVLITSAAPNSPTDAPVQVLTPVAAINSDALGGTQKTALETWAVSALGWMYPVVFGFQNLLKQRRPFILLTILGLGPVAATDSSTQNGEQIGGLREGILSVMTVSDPNQLPWTQVSIPSPAAGVYTVTVNGQPVSVTEVGTPTAAQIVADLVTAAQAGLAPSAGTLTGFDAWAAGQALDQLMLATTDETTLLTVTLTGNLAQAPFVPVGADVLAQRLQSALRNPDQLDALDLAGIGIGDTHSTLNLSQLLDTGYEERHQFDVALNLAENQAYVPAIIDTITAPIGTFNP